MNYWQDIHDNECGAWWYGSWWVLNCASSAQQIADAYKEGVDWFYTLDPTWKSLIGATGMQVVHKGCDYYRLNEDEWAGHADHCDEYLGFDADCSPNFGYDCEEDVYQLESYYKPSDGFILAESAMNAPGRNYELQFMDGSNHMQMKNDSKMEEAIVKIFVVGIEVNRNFFNTDER